MIRILQSFGLFFISLFLVSCAEISQVHEKKTQSQLKKENPPQTTNQFTFAWPFTESSKMKPRGGTTFGLNVVLDEKPNKRWKLLREKNLTNFERDRRAILAMTGAYRVSFDFIETLGFSKNYSPSQPYQSWGTEYVYLVEDESDFISLQHILVMFFSPVLTDDKPEPIVIKHWRQDWKYQDKKIHVYTGFKTWKTINFTNEKVKGKWSQSVFQVDDSPRYQATGKWKHTGNASSWLSSETWRPLPRREFSVRDDYNVLIGTNSHTITPYGWVLEEENLKAILTTPENLKKIDPIVAKEIGVARYERIVGHDWSAGDSYWKKTGPFWKQVRNTWNNLLEDKPSIKFNLDKEGPPLFMTMFNLADESIYEEKTQNFRKEKIENAINSYLINQ